MQPNYFVEKNLFEDVEVIKNSWKVVKIYKYAAGGRGRCRNVVLCYFMRFKLDIFKIYLKKELKFEMQNAKIEGSNPLYYRIINFQHGYWFFFQTALLLF